MPRISAAAASVAQMPHIRAAPPKDMPADQAELWKRVVATKPADWFTADALPVLLQFCRHVSTAALLEGRIAASTEDGIDKLDKLLALRDRESKAIQRLATALRLTPQSRIRPDTAHTQVTATGGADRPW